MVSAVEGAGWGGTQMVVKEQAGKDDVPYFSCVLTTKLKQGTYRQPHYTWYGTLMKQLKEPQTGNISLNH